MVKKYINPVHGKYGVFGSNYPAEMTKEEVIHYGASEVVGSSKGLENAFDSFLEWLEDSGSQKIDFRYEDLSIEELIIIDDIVFSCSGCGWLCSTDEKHDNHGDVLCDQCYDAIEYDEDDEWDDEDEEDDDF